MYSVTRETPEDRWEVEGLYDLCFAPGREALSSYRLRDGVAPVAALCLVARDGDGILAGAIRFWPVSIERRWQALLLGPIAVHPTRQGEGLGALLMREALQRAQDMGHDRVLLVGDAPYYGRFGFRLLEDIVMPPPTNPERVLGIGAWEGLGGRVLNAAQVQEQVQEEAGETGGNVLSALNHDPA